MTRQGWYRFVRRPARIGLSVAIAAVLTSAFGTAVARGASETDPPPADGGAKLIQPPETLDALKTLNDQVSTELAQLQPTTQPTTSVPSSQPAEIAAAQQTATALYGSLQRLAGRLDQLITLRAQVDDLKSPEHIEAFAKESASLQQRTTELEAKIADPPPYVSEEEIKKTQGEYDAQLTEARTRLALRTERTKTLASAPQRRQEAAAEIQKAQVSFQGQFAQLAAKRDAAKTPTERRHFEQEIRKAVIEASLPTFDEAIVKLSEERDTILQGQADRRMPLTRAYLLKLADWKNLLQQIRSRGERERVRAELEFISRHPTEVPAYAQTYWQFKLLELDARERLEKQEQALRGRFVQFAAVDPKQDLPTEQASWGLIVESIGRRPSGDIRVLYENVQAAIHTWQRRLDTMRRLLDATVDDQRKLAATIDTFDAKMRATAATFNDQLNEYLLQHAGDTRAEQLNQDYVETKSRYSQQAQRLQLDMGRMIARIKESAGTIESFVEELEKYRSQLYWRYLYVPERPIWSYRWSATMDEWFSQPEQSQRENDRQALREQAAAITPAEWTGFAFTIVAVAGAAVWIRRRAKRYANEIVKRLAETKAGEEEHTAPIAERLHLLAARYVARTAPLVLPAATAMIFVHVFDVTGTTHTLASAVLLFVIGAVLSEGMFRLLFVPGKPRLRLLRCSNVVAAHYRRWGVTLCTAMVILVPVPLVLWSLDLAPYTRSYLASAFKMVALLIVLLFGFRKQYVIRVVGRPEQVQHRGVLAIVSAVYPLAWLGATALLVAQVMGYAALVTYVLLGCLETVATIIVALLLSRYVTDLLTRYEEAILARLGTAGPTPAPAAPGGGASTGAAEGEPGGPDMAVQLTAGLFRWAVAVAAILACLQYWGITTVEIRSVLGYEFLSANAATGRAAITVGSVLAAILSVIAAWWGSRAIRSVLTRRVYPAYAGIDRGAQAAINTILHYFIMLLGLYFALFAMRVPLGALTVVLGTLGLGIGLGLQPLFVNFISGLMILFERHVRVGDLIVVSGELGEVTNISMRSTAIRTPDGIELIIPNSDFITKDVVNWTLQGARLRGRVKVGVAYGSDVELVRRLLHELALRHPLVLSSPPPEVWFMDFGENSLDFEIVAWFRDSATRWRFVTQIRYDITRIFKEHGIEIPFPQRTLSTIGGQPLPVRIIHPEEAMGDAVMPPPPADQPPGGTAGRRGETG